MLSVKVLNKDIEGDKLVEISQLSENLIRHFSLEMDVEVTITDSGEDNLDGFHDLRDGVHHILFTNIGHLPTLVHEFIHAHQHERGDLKISKQVRWWKGEVNTDRYLYQPWEIEAFETQEIIYNEVRNNK